MTNLTTDHMDVNVVVLEDGDADFFAVSQQAEVIFGEWFGRNRCRAGRREAGGMLEALRAEGLVVLTPW
jgi:hypothetical protein